MAPYFDHTDATHTALLPRVQREHADLESTAAVAEADVIEHFTRRFPTAPDYQSNFYTSRGYDKGGGVFVGLEGFNPDANVVIDTELVLALRRTIADVIAWRLHKAGENPTLESVSTAVGISKTKVAAFAAQYPPGPWAHRLKRWDVRAPNTVV